MNRILAAAQDPRPSAVAAGGASFAAQDTPVYAGLSVADHLRLGARLNPGWDAGYAQYRVDGSASTWPSGPASSLWLRPHLISPVRSTAALSASAIQGFGMDQNGSHFSVIPVSPDSPGAWIYSNQALTASGSATLGAVPQACQPQQGQPPPSPQACINAIAQMHLKQVVTYQPANRYWTFQWLETGIYLTAAILLAWGCFRWVRRRLS